MIPLAGLRLLLLPLGELLGGAEGHAVDAREHLVLAVVFPVGAGLLGDLEGLERLGVGDVGADAHVHILALLEEAELGFVGQVRHVLDLVVLAALAHERHGFLARQDKGLEGQILLADLLHFLLDGLEILVGELGVAQIHIIVKAVLGRRAEGKVRLREQALDGLSHDVRGAVAQDVDLLLRRALAHMAVLVDDLHSLSSKYIISFQMIKPLRPFGRRGA